MQPVTLGPTPEDSALERYASRVAILMPSFGTCSFRLENERTTKHWYATRNLSVFPGTDQATSGFFSRARAINTAARAAYHTSPERDIYILADNDLIPSVPHLVEALAAANSYSAITPHLTTLHTSHAGREHLLNGNTTFLYRPKESGSKSYVVIRREVFAHINGMDELFEGWGPEDKAFLLNIHRQLGHVLELDGARTHLWHPGDRSKANRTQLMHNRNRCKQYEHADQPTATLLAKEYGHWLERDQ